MLAETLAEIERVNAGGPITMFEALIAAGLLLFARVPADLAILEVGLGGRHDATNVVAGKRATAITSVSMDHEHFLGDTLALIAAEKAGIIRPGVPCVTGRQHPAVAEVLDAEARLAGTILLARDREWSIAEDGVGLVYQDKFGRLDLPRPSLLGRHQVDNAGIAIAALRHAARGDPALDLPEAAYAAISRADWPARLQRLHGRLARILPGSELWLDGGHNPGAGQALAETLAEWRDRPLHLVVGMRETKDASGFLAPLLPYADRVFAVREPGQEMALGWDEIIAASGGRASIGPGVEGALSALAAGPAGRVLICGSLYLAGEVLKLDGAPV